MSDLFTLTNILLWLATGFVWGLAYQLNDINRWRDQFNERYTNGHLLALLLWWTPSGFCTVLTTSIYILCDVIGRNGFLKKPLIK